jgi:sialic acid synthase SpsE
MDLGLFKIGNGSNQVIFAEEGQANQGDINFAFKMIDIASKAGASGLEFQIGIAEDLYFPDDEGYKIYKKSRELIINIYSINLVKLSFLKNKI